MLVAAIKSLGLGTIILGVLTGKNCSATNSNLVAII